MLTHSQFAAWLQARRDAGETLAAIGERFGVSHVTVAHWLSGKRNPSRMTLVLAGELGRAPMEMAAGLPSPQEPFPGA
jgi:transcriptional regulator with XRE-family HTH domain